MLYIVFEYCDNFSGGAWLRQECYVSSVAECIEIYGLGVDCDYRFVSIEQVL